MSDKVIKEAIIKIKENITNLLAISTSTKEDIEEANQTNLLLKAPGQMALALQLTNKLKNELKFANQSLFPDKYKNKYIKTINENIKLLNPTTGKSAAASAAAAAAASASASASASAPTSSSASGVAGFGAPPPKRKRKRKEKE